MGEEARGRLPDFEPDALSSLCRAVALGSLRLGPQKQLMSALAAEAEARARSAAFGPREIVVVASAFALSSRPARPSLYGALASEARRQIEGFKPEELCSIAQAFKQAERAAADSGAAAGGGAAAGRRLGSAGDGAAAAGGGAARDAFLEALSEAACARQVELSDEQRSSLVSSLREMGLSDPFRD